MQYLMAVKLVNDIIQLGTLKIMFSQETFPHVKTDFLLSINVY